MNARRTRAAVEAALPPGVELGGVDFDSTIVTLSAPPAPPEACGPWNGHHTLIGCKSWASVDEVLRAYLPARGFVYPYTPPPPQTSIFDLLEGAS